MGNVVLTQYNNKTYKIDDVDEDSTPRSTFMYNKTEISFADYMKTKYDIKIRDLNQPLLVSKSKARDVRAGGEEIIRLIPELCYCTGLNKNMKYVVCTHVTFRTYYYTNMDNLH